MKLNCIKIVFSFFLLTILACGSSKNTATQAEIDHLNTLIKQKTFRIENDWAYPTASLAMQQASQLLPPGNSGNAVNLIGNSNFLAIEGDSITSYLPYFGERQMGGGYSNDDGAIQFKGTMKDYKVTPNKNSGYDISFEANSHSENFSVNLIIFPSLKSEIILTGSKRTLIKYSGRIVPQTDKAE